MYVRGRDALQQSRVIAWIGAVAGLVLLVPLVVMQFTDEMSWGPLDFIAMGGLIFGTGLALIAVFGLTTSTLSRIVIGIVVVLAFLLLWAELAVGVIGTLFAGS